MSDKIIKYFDIYAALSYPEYDFSTDIVPYFYNITLLYIVQ